MLKIKIGENFKIASKPVIGEMDLHPKGLHLVLGSNGVGKTSFFNYLLAHQSKFGMQGMASFAPQYRIAPVNSMTVLQMFNQAYANFEARVKCAPLDYELFDVFNATHLLAKNVTNLSGGENQLVKILLTFYLKANYYFLDEPFQFLDTHKFKVLFNYIVNHPTAAMVIIDHRNPELLSHANYKYELVERQGEVRLGEMRHD